MGTTRRDIFGDPPGAGPATGGSYGRPPSGHRLPADTRPGPVRLQVADVERSIHYYETVLGLRAVERGADRASLAPRHGERVLLELVGVPGSAPAGRRARLGLFHFAILLPDRATLGRFVRHLAQSGIHAGAGDHLVSEAFYLTDPDGLGIEVYADRPRETWRHVGGELMMATDPVDVDAVVAAAGDQPWTGMPADTVMGHVHLHVGDLDAASAFYSEALGFDLMVWSYPGALFLGAGGYHHHLGTNTWAGPGAAAPGPGDARLLEWTLELPDADAVQRVRRSLADAGHEPQDAPDDGVLCADPWGTHVRIRTRML